MAGVAGFEPAHGDTKNRCLTAWLHPNRRYGFLCKPKGATKISFQTVASKMLKAGKEEKWCPHTDSNRGPDDYKSTALPTEL
tara:strand:+ start:1503 stop:1748 length:246 start_codon:yes stop_codon:yes gene_type:complete